MNDNLNMQQVRDKVLFAILQMSDKQVDPKVKEVIKPMIGKSIEEIKDEMIFLLDDIVYYSLTSDFELKVLKLLMKHEGVNDDYISSPSMMNRRMGRMEKGKL